MLESVGELVVLLLETLGWIVDAGSQPPRAGHRYRVRRQIDAVGQVRSTSEAGTAFEARLAPGSVFRIAHGPAAESSDVSICPENGLMDGVVPRTHRAAAMATGYHLQVPIVLLASHCTRISTERQRKADG